ncbi:molecular chaperone HtpG [Campylobacter sp. FMV-PI01]|uniref:Chaperone protein HtpG n=1 Tax=Campylobacter portucalensis TaxID=2608384 RepID=A0A6L5WIF7_9BACT|nr:molecular chaperone HtpG [Campylobacter portucalensis]MSN97000.1 molecular chaperone HtpG [Campylobacter portucalensis]
MKKHEFQTEVSDLLNLMIHSLYSNKEIFLRELISNSSDALDKLNYLYLTDEKYKTLNYTPRIDIKLDKTNKTLIIEDNGIGMDEDELVLNLGTIARSGTKGFLSQISKDAKKDSNLIGQFGVGFYSAFMVADKIEVLSKKALSDEANLWISDAKSFSVEKSSKQSNGTSIKLYLKDDEFLNEFTIQNIIKKYSNHIPYPIFMDKEEYVSSKDDNKTPKTEIKNTQINNASALWQMQKSSLKDSDYNEFYKQISHDSTDPLMHIHTKAEGKIEYTTLFYIPSIQPFDLYRADYQSGVKLYVKRVFITDDEKELLPTFLRFVRGIIDIEDLPLNVSREILQENRVMASVKDASVKKILSELEKILKNDREKYIKFYKLFGKVLKEGLYGFNAHKDEILNLVLFKTSKREDFITLKEYKDGMKKDQKEIYYISGKSYEALKNSPILEILKDKDIEVLICDDDIDAIILPMIFEYDKTPIKPASEAEFSEEKIDQKEYENVILKLKEILKNDVKDVRVTSRLKESIACLVYDKNDPNFETQQILKQMGQENLPEILPILEINPNHKIATKLLNNEENLDDLAKIILNIAKIQEGLEVKNPNEFAKILTNLITQLA